jgi:uncharacterized protein YacL
MSKLIDNTKEFFDSFSDSFIAFFPTIILFVVAVAGSAIIGFLFGILMRLTRLDKRMEKSRFLRTFLHGSSLPTHKFIGRVIFVILLVISLEVIANMNDWSSLSDGFKDYSTFIPKLLGSIILVTVGIFVSRYIQKTIEIFLERSGAKSSSLLARLSFYALMTVIISIALSHLGVNMRIVTMNLSIILGAFLFAFAVSFAFASKDLLGNILSSSYNRKNFEVGQKIYVDGTKGEIIKITNISIFVKTTDKIKVIPAKKFTDETVEIVG